MQKNLIFLNIFNSIKFSRFHCSVNVEDCGLGLKQVWFEGDLTC